MIHRHEHEHFHEHFHERGQDHCRDPESMDLGYYRVAHSPIWQMRLINKLFVNKVFKPNGKSPPKPPPFVLFMLIDCDERLVLDQKEIAARMHVTPATIAATLKHLQRDGLIRKREDPKDLRRNLVEITDEGSELIRRHTQAIHNVESRALNGLNEAEIAELNRLLGRIAENLKRYPSTTPND